VIEVNARSLRDITADAVQALADAASSIYVRAGELVRVRCDENNRPLIEPLSEDALRGILERAATFERTTTRGVVPVSPPREVVRDVASLGTWPFRPLEGITETPALRPDGTVLSEPGYDPLSRLIYMPAPGIAIPSIRQAPSKAERAAALALLLDDTLGDFPFNSPASRANCLALLLTPVLRPAIRGQVPCALLDAPKSGTGKGLISNITSQITTGRPAAMFAAPTNEPEWQKSVLAVLARGSTYVHIDEVNELRSPTLAAALTATTFEGRLLGRSQMVQVPQRATWVAAGNNIVVRGDLARRCYEIRLDAKVARPWLRTGFRHKELLAWVAEHRPELLAALLTLARAWYAAGHPPAPVPPIGGFDEWARIVGGILAHAGVHDFLGNLTDFYEQADAESSEWEAFLAALYDRYGGEPFKVRELAQRLHSEPELRDTLPDDLVEALEKPPASFKARLGKALGKRDGTRYGDDGLRIEHAGDDSRSGVASWRIQRDAEVHRSHRYSNPVRNETNHIDGTENTSATSAPLQHQEKEQPRPARTRSVVSAETRSAASGDGFAAVADDGGES
jgi:hypothetical protein